MHAALRIPKGPGVSALLSRRRAPRGEEGAAEDEAHKFFFADIEEKPPKPRFRVLCRTEELTELITTGLMETADRIAAEAWYRGSVSGESPARGGGSMIS